MLLAKEAAKLIGVEVNTFRKWARESNILPAKTEFIKQPRNRYRQNYFKLEDVNKIKALHEKKS